MTEPVGNSPRGAIPSNSFRDREQSPKTAAEPREKIEKVVEGKVVFTKKPWYKRAARNMVAEDVQNIGDFLLIDVFVPAIKNLLFDIITQATGRALYQGGRHVTRGGFGQSQGQGGIRERYSEYSGGQQRREISSTARARHEFDDVTLDDREEAVKVVSDLVTLCEKYGRATVYELFELLGTTGSHADQNWGWTDLREADVVQNRGGWRLALPPPVELKR